MFYNIDSRSSCACPAPDRRSSRWRTSTRSTAFHSPPPVPKTFRFRTRPSTSRWRHRVGDASESSSRPPSRHGCQMACFQTKNPNLGKFWRVLQYKMFVYFTDIWSILRPFGINCVHSVYFMVIWYIFSRFGIMYQEKSGNSVLSPNFKPKFWSKNNKIVWVLWTTILSLRYFETNWGSQ
jgi:hypothetical protein